MAINSKYERNLFCWSNNQWRFRIEFDLLEVRIGWVFDDVRAKTVDCKNLTINLLVFQILIGKFRPK